MNNEMINDIIQKGISEIDKEVKQEHDIEEQSKLIVKAILEEPSLSTFTYINDKLFLISLSTRNEDKSMTKPVDLYYITASDVMKAMAVSNGNIDLLNKVRTHQSSGTGDNRIHIPPQIYRPFTATFELDKAEKVCVEAPGLNRAMYSLISYLYGKLIVEELPEE